MSVKVKIQFDAEVKREGNRGCWVEHESFDGSVDTIWYPLSVCTLIMPDDEDKPHLAETLNMINREDLDQPLTVAQFAALLGLSEETVRRRIADETIPSIRLAGVLRIPRQFVRDLIAGKVA